MRELVESRWLKHPFHLVTPSPWPLIGSIAGLTVTLGGVLYMHYYVRSGVTVLSGIALVVLVMLVWWRDVVREGTYEGVHTGMVQRGLRIGVVLFIVSEVMFFFAFFWAFFHASLAPTVEIGSIWPPRFINAFNPWGVPLGNTFILLLSGISLTSVHQNMITGNLRRAVIGFILTLSLAVLFTMVQVMEYVEAPFTIADGVYGSSFFMATGFHGFHVIIGTTFITVCLIRFLRGHFTRQHHLGFEAAAWYWHFVDVVWLYLYLFVYCWAYRGV